MSRYLITSEKKYQSLMDQLKGCKGPWENMSLEEFANYWDEIEHISNEAHLYSDSFSRVGPCLNSKKINSVVNKSIVMDKSKSKTEEESKTEDEYMKLFKDYLTKHGLIQQGWTVKFNSRLISKRGECNYGKKFIQLSSHLLKFTDQKVMNIFLHELAHALTPGQQHSDVWREKAIELGCDGKRCDSSGDKLVESKYVMTCANLCFSRDRHRLVDMSKKMCRFCKGKIMIKIRDS